MFFFVFFQNQLSDSSRLGDRARAMRVPKFYPYTSLMEVLVSSRLAGMLASELLFPLPRRLDSLSSIPPILVHCCYFVFYVTSSLSCSACIVFVYFIVCHRELSSLSFMSHRQISPPDKLEWDFCLKPGQEYSLTFLLYITDAIENYYFPLCRSVFRNGLGYLMASNFASYLLLAKVLVLEKNSGPMNETFLLTTFLPLPQKPLIKRGIT